MRNRIGQFVAIVSVAALPLGIACGHSRSDQNYQNSAGDVAPATTPSGPTSAAPLSPTDTVATAPKHHSKLAGAVVGGIVGHELGHHALAGAAAGAFVQHERNKRP